MDLPVGCQVEPCLLDRWRFQSRVQAVRHTPLLLWLADPVLIDFVVLVFIMDERDGVPSRWQVRNLYRLRTRLRRDRDVSESDSAIFGPALVRIEYQYAKVSGGTAHTVDYDGECAGRSGLS